MFCDANWWSKKSYQFIVVNYWLVSVVRTGRRILHTGSYLQCSTCEQSRHKGTQLICTRLASVALILHINPYRPTVTTLHAWDLLSIGTDINVHQQYLSWLQSHQAQLGEYLCPFLLYLNVYDYYYYDIVASCRCPEAIECGYSCIIRSKLTNCRAAEPGDLQK